MNKTDIYVKATNNTPNVLTVSGNFKLGPFETKTQYMSFVQLVEEMAPKLEALQNANKISYSIVSGPDGVGSPTVLHAGIEGVLTAGATNYALPNYVESATDVLGFVATQNGVLRNLKCAVSTAPGAAESVVVTVLVNGLVQLLAATIADTNLSASGTENQVAV